MSGTRRTRFSGDTVGLIVRGKVAPGHHPGVLEQHADCILSNGAPVGFFGEGDGAKLNSAGLNMRGTVYDYKLMQRMRKFYVDFDSARSYKLVSSVVLVRVSRAEATAFDGYWKSLQDTPGRFHLLGGNCSTHASGGFVVSGILSRGIPGLDTPDNLYAQLVKRRKDDVTVSAGFIGFEPAAGGGFEMLTEPYVMASEVPAPNQSSFSY